MGTDPKLPSESVQAPTKSGDPAGKLPTPGKSLPSTTAVPTVVDYTPTFKIGHPHHFTIHGTNFGTSGATARIVHQDSGVTWTAQAPIHQTNMRLVFIATPTRDHTAPTKAAGDFTITVTNNTGGNSTPVPTSGMTHPSPPPVYED